MENRKVVFSFIPLTGFTPEEEEQKELDEMARKREGLFHGETEVEENGLKKTLFVIEDLETGKVNNVDPLLVEFKYEDNERK